MDLTIPKHLDTRALTAPISRVGDRLPAADEIVASVTSTVGNVGSELAHQVADLDLPGTVADTARRSRRAVARVVPWIAPPPRRFYTRTWFLAIVLTGAVVGVAMLMRRRTSEPDAVPPRDDWSTRSSNGTTPSSADIGRSARDTASTSA